MNYRMCLDEQGDFVCRVSVAGLAVAGVRLGLGFICQCAGYCRCDSVRDLISLKPNETGYSLCTLGSSINVCM